MKPQIELVHYQEAMERLNDLLRRIKNRLEREPESVYATLIFQAIFFAQQQTLDQINDENFHCPVAWDKKTGLPSHPSLIADVQKYAEIFKPEPVKTAVLTAFNGWVPLTAQTINCCCGRGFKSKQSTVQTMLNIGLKATGKILAMKMLAGVKSEDSSHLAHHYKIQKNSKVVDGCNIIFESETTISKSDRQLLISSTEETSDDLFDKEKFLKLITNALAP